ncbi:hypothetical protein AURDEDRAFT_168520 [Auricularia subglabra TFB-10046 SS5]|nr:hypothetical protein AURDEDRAFT_168520 [Auricularia subglabra TFB-10046 SS5]
MAGSGRSASWTTHGQTEQPSFNGVRSGKGFKSKREGASRLTPACPPVTCGAALKMQSELLYPGHAVLALGARLPVSGRSGVISAYDAVVRGRDARREFRSCTPSCLLKMGADVVGIGKAGHVDMCSARRDQSGGEWIVLGRPAAIENNGGDTGNEGVHLTVVIRGHRSQVVLIALLLGLGLAEIGSVARMTVTLPILRVVARLHVRKFRPHLFKQRYNSSRCRGA